jgi:hypothetical protein
VVKTGFCQKNFSQTNEQQRHLKEKLISELDVDVDCRVHSNHLKNTFFSPQQMLAHKKTLTAAEL